MEGMEALEALGQELMSWSGRDSFSDSMVVR
ncbi:hypothetical protein NPIL_84611, partial [Nephila pilipes]